MILMLLLQFSDPLFTEKSAGTIIGKVDAKDQKYIPHWWQKKPLDVIYSLHSDEQMYTKALFLTHGI
jgi:hypothetical protein